MTPRPTILPDKLRSIAQTLLAKTKANQVNWIIESSEEEVQFFVLLPHSSIVLEYSSPRLETDYVTLKLVNEDDFSVASLRADRPTPGEPPHPDWELLSDLYAEVHRAVTGWDKVLSEVEGALASPGPIGTNN